MKASSGSLVFAAAGGVAHTHTDAYFTEDNQCLPGESWGRWVDIQHTNGTTTFYAHLGSYDQSIDGQTIQAGRFIGVQGNAGCATTEHLHFEVHWTSSGEAVDPGNPQSCDIGTALWTTCPASPAPPTPTPTPRNLGQSCTSDVEPPQRISQLRSDGRFYVKEGSFTEPWIEQATDVVAIALSGDRIGQLRSDGRFYVKEGSFTEPWIEQATDVAAIALSGARSAEPPTATPTVAPPVGGIAEYPDVEAPAADSGPSAGTYALAIGLVTVALGTLVAGARYARRRWLR